MNEYARARHKNHQPPSPAPRQGKPRTSLRRVSKKRAALMSKVGPERRARKEEIGCCMICRQPFHPEELDGDEIARGPAREKCLSEPTLTIISCRKCHTISQDWPIPKRMAVLSRWEDGQRAALYNRLVGTADTHVTSDDITTYRMYRKPVVKKRGKRGKRQDTKAVSPARTSEGEAIQVATTTEKQS